MKRGGKMTSLLSGKNPKTRDNLFDLKIKQITEDMIYCDGNIYKAIFEITSINTSLLDDDDKEKVMNTILSALSSINGRFGIYCLSSSLNIQKNIESIDDYMQGDKIDSELKLSLLESQKQFFIQCASRQDRSVFRFYLVIEQTAKTSEIAQSGLYHAFRNIKMNLEAADFSVRRLKTNDIFDLLYQQLNPLTSKHTPCDYTVAGLLPQYARRNRDGRHIEVDGLYYRHFSIKGFPQQVNLYCWLNNLLDLDNTDIAYVIKPKDRSQTLKKMSKRMVEFRGDQNSNDALAQTEADQNIQSTQELLKNITSKNMPFYDVSILLSVHATDYEKLDIACEKVKNTVQGGMMCSLIEVMYHDFDPYFAALPMLTSNFVTNNYTHNMTGEDFASLIPFSSSEMMMESGVIIGENTQSGGLCVIDKVNNNFENQHECIIAMTGSGKTFKMKIDILRELPYVDNTIIFDVKGEYIFPYGSRYRFSIKSNTKVNPFHMRSTMSYDTATNKMFDNLQEVLADKIINTIPFFRWIMPEMTAFDEALLEEDVRDLYANFGITFESRSLPAVLPTFSDFAAVLEDKINSKEASAKSKEARQNMLAILNPYINGTYSGIFNGQTNYSFDFLTVFDISEVNEAIQRPLYHILLNDTAAFCRESGVINPTRKNVVIDECHVFANENNLQTLIFIYTLIKVYRAFGVKIITATQQAGDLLKESLKGYGQGIIDNSYFKTFLRVGDADFRQLAELYKFSKEELNVLRGIGSKLTGSIKGRAVFMAGAMRCLVQVVASKDELEIIDPVQYENQYGEKSRYYG